MALSKAQENAMRVVTDKWRSVYDINIAGGGVSMATLDALVSKGILRKRVEPGASFKMMQKSKTFYCKTA